MRITFAELASKIGSPTFSLTPTARLRIPTHLEVFVPPDLRVVDGDAAALAAEVIFVEASAAVGKTTMAKALSAGTGAPLLDLAEVPVSTQSLLGLLQSDFSGAGSPIEGFHRGEIPVIVDALDEGRLLSGEQGFELFLETTGQLLHASRVEPALPKLVCFCLPGRGVR